MNILHAVVTSAALASLGGINVPSDLGNRLEHIRPASRTDSADERGQSEPSAAAPEPTPGERLAGREFRQNMSRLAEDLLPLSSDRLPTGEVGGTTFYERSTRSLQMKEIDMDGMTEKDLRFSIPIEYAPQEPIAAKDLANAAYICGAITLDMSAEDACFLAQNAAFALAGEAVCVALPPPAPASLAACAQATDAATRAAEGETRYHVSREALRAAFEASTDGVASLHERRDTFRLSEPPDPLQQTTSTPLSEPPFHAAAESAVSSGESSGGLHDPGQALVEAMSSAVEAAKSAEATVVRAQQDLRKATESVLCDDCGP